METRDPGIKLTFTGVGVEAARGQRQVNQLPLYTEGGVSATAQAPHAGAGVATSLHAMGLLREPGEQHGGPDGASVCAAYEAVGLCPRPETRCSLKGFRDWAPQEGRVDSRTRERRLLVPRNQGGCLGVPCVLGASACGKGSSVGCPEPRIRTAVGPGVGGGWHAVACRESGWQVRAL